MSPAVHDRFALPVFRVPVTFAAADGLTEELARVDTVVIEPEERRFSLLARASARLPGGPLSLRCAVAGPLTAGVRGPWSGKRHLRLEEDAA